MDLDCLLRGLACARRLSCCQVSSRRASATDIGHLQRRRGQQAVICAGLNGSAEAWPRPALLAWLFVFIKGSTGGVMGWG